MKAVVYETYGPPEVLQLREMEKPVPKDDEVLIKVHAASVNAADWRLLMADPFLVRLMGGGLFKPSHKILGSDIAGRIEAVGKKATQFRVGDEVFGDIFKSGRGGFAEYVCAHENELVLKPSVMTFEEAAAVPMAAVTALQALRDVGLLQKGQQVLINGASGGVGTYAVQLAKAFGAEVTAVCSTGKIETARSLGADAVIDYTTEDFTKNGRRYDLILAVNGYHPIGDYKRSLKTNGRYVMAGGSKDQLFQALLLGPWLSLAGNRKILTASAAASQKDLSYLKELIEGGKLRSVIDRRYPLSEVPDALRYVYEGHAAGKVIIAVA
jgi:NADPH:quinone reductase-like Zn-dependent oxidoreductase